MNRHDRRKAMSLNKQIMQWPVLPPGEFPKGRVSHMMVRHDDWCKTLQTGNGEDCNCEPLVTTHLQPTLTK